MARGATPSTNALRLVSSEDLPIKNHLAAFARFHRSEAALEFVRTEAVRDDRRDVEPALDHDRHLVPRLVHLAAIDAFDREHVENDLVPVDRNLAAGDAEQRDLSAVRHVVDHLAEGGGVAAHLEAHVEAL